MKDNYPYFKDPRALAEIRKHRWIESQKAGREAGFPSAAVDWIKKYGEKWKRIHAQEYRNEEIFLERRKYRRFKLQGMVQLLRESISIFAKPIDLSFFGLLCRTDEGLSLGSNIKVRMSLELQQSKKDLECFGRIERVVCVGLNRYDVFLSFNECCQKNIGKALF